MKSLGWALILYDQCLCKKRLGHRHTERRPWKDMERGLRRNQPFQHLDLRLASARKVRKAVSVVSATQTNTILLRADKLEITDNVRCW